MAQVPGLRISSHLGADAVGHAQNRLQKRAVSFLQINKGRDCAVRCCSTAPANRIHRIEWSLVHPPAVVGVVEVAPLHPAQEAGQLDLTQIEAAHQARVLDEMKGQHRQVVVVGLLRKGKHVELPAALGLLQYQT